MMENAAKGCYFHEDFPRNVIEKKNRKMTEAVVCMCSSKWLFLKVSQYSQGDICVEVSL